MWIKLAFKTIVIQNYYDFIIGTVSLISMEPPSNNCNALLLKTANWSKVLKKLSLFDSKICWILTISPLFLMSQKCAITLGEKPQMKINSFEKPNMEFKIIHTWSHKALKVTVVNQAWPSLHGGSLEIMLSVS